MSEVPRDRALDVTPALLREGYTFTSSRVARYGSDVFSARLMLQEAVFALGEEAARVFYEPDLFSRKFSLPPTTLKLLLDKGSVQQLDGAAHHRRKQMFMSLMTPESVDLLEGHVRNVWEAAIPGWERAREVVLHGALQEVLCRAVCRWAGVPLVGGDGARRTREFAAMISGAGSVGPRSWWGMALRTRAERWARRLVEAVRSGALVPPEASALQTIATHHDDRGELLDVPVAAVELINVLRPTVAVARFVTFAAHALHEHPQYREQLRDEQVAACFVQEVRRSYPFFPLVAGRAKEAFSLRGHTFAPGTWLLLDVYGTNRDPRIWGDADAFRPERFSTWDHSPFNFIPQGGGDFHTGHRCAGEWITIRLMRVLLALLLQTRYTVPEQDLSIDLGRMPAIPASGFVINPVG